MDIDIETIAKVMGKLDSLELIARETREDLRATRDEHIELKVSARHKHREVERRIQEIEAGREEREQRFDTELARMEELRVEIANWLHEMKGREKGRHEGAMEGGHGSVTVETNINADRTETTFNDRVDEANVAEQIGDRIEGDGKPAGSDE